MDTAGSDQLGVDAVVYPGLLSDISLNDGGGGRASFGRRDTPSAANGVPTVIFPVGYDNAGQPINIQLMGRAWDDDKLVVTRSGQKGGSMTQTFELDKGGNELTVRTKAQRKDVGEFEMKRVYTRQH